MLSWLKSSGKSSLAASEIDAHRRTRNPALAADGLDRFRFHLHRVRSGGAPQFRFLDRRGRDAGRAEKLRRLCAGGCQPATQLLVVRGKKYVAGYERRIQSAGETAGQDEARRELLQSLHQRALGILPPDAGDENGNRRPVRHSLLESARLLLQRKAHEPIASGGRGIRTGRTSLDARQPFLPHAVKFHRGAHVAQAVFGDVAEFAFGHQRVHVHAGDAVGLGRVDAERFAVEIQVELARRAFASADAVEGELLGEVAVRFGREAVAEPVLLGDGHVQDRRTQIEEWHVEAAPVEGHDLVVVLRHVPERGEQFHFVGARHELDRAAVRGVLLEILRE